MEPTFHLVGSGGASGADEGKLVICLAEFNDSGRGHKRPGKALLGGAPSLPMWWRMTSVVEMLHISVETCYSPCPCCPCHCGICPGAWMRSHGSLLSRVPWHYFNGGEHLLWHRLSTWRVCRCLWQGGLGRLPSGFGRFSILAG